MNEVPKIQNIPKKINRRPKTRSVIDIKQINWYRRQKSKQFLQDGLTYLLIEKENSLSFLSRLVLESSYQKSKKSFSETKKFNPKLYFNPTELSKIYKIRDLFYEFDKDKSRTLDMDELYKMFNTNNIPITYAQLRAVFNYKNTLTLMDLVNFILGDEDKENFLNVMRQIKEDLYQKEKKKRYIPTDFNELLEYFSEQGKIRDNMKILRKSIGKLTRFERRQTQNIDTAGNEIPKERILQKIGLFQSVNYKHVENTFADMVKISKNKVLKMDKIINTKYNSSQCSQRNLFITDSSFNTNSISTLPSVPNTERSYSRNKVLNIKTIRNKHVRYATFIHPITSFE